MATFEEHIEGLTQIDITTTSAPTQSELTGFLIDGIIDCVNRIIKYKPEELSKFTRTTNATDSVAKKGKILSVLREHDSTSILRICTPIPPQLRYEATDSTSLHYRSKYNPAFYELDGNIYTVPDAASGDNDMVVTQINYDTGIVYSTGYNAGVIENFPLDYEYLVGLYAAANACQSAASDLQNNMPTKPTLPEIPNLTRIATKLPSLPIYKPARFSFNSHNIINSIEKEDFDKAEQYTKYLEKSFEAFDKREGQENAIYQRDLEVFKSEMESLIKDSDRNTQIEATEYRNRIFKHQYDVSQYQAEMTESLAKYKWFIEQAAKFYALYVEGTTGMAQQSKARRKEDTQDKRREE